MRCVSSDRFFRRKHALPLPWRTRGRAPRVSVRARSLPLPSGPCAPCGVRLHADPPDAPPPASRCSRHPATHSSFPHRPRCNRWAGQGAAGRPIPSHHSDCVRCRIPANSSRLTAGPFAKQAYLHLFTRPICRASEYVTGTTLADNPVTSRIDIALRRRFVYRPTRSSCFAPWIADVAATSDTATALDSDALDGGGGTVPQQCLAGLVNPFAAMAPDWANWSSSSCSSLAAADGSLVLTQNEPCSAASPNAIAGLAPPNVLCGDFDVQVDFAVTGLVAGVTGGIFASMRANDPTVTTNGMTIERYAAEYLPRPARATKTTRATPPTRGTTRPLCLSLRQT
jgi:hypothetical protein